MVKNLSTVWETQVRSLGWEDPLEKEKASHSVFLPGEFQGKRSLVGYSWVTKSQDTTEQLTLSLSHSCCTILYKLQVYTILK